MKVLPIWMAASLAGKEMYLVCDDSQRGFADKCECFVERVRLGWSVAELDACLKGVDGGVGRWETMD